MEKIDFTRQQHFPGSTGNPFDIFLHRMSELERAPGWLFAAGLFALATLAGWLDWRWALTWWAFFLVDWALIAALPRANKSYGPPKPAVTALALARAIFAALPLPPVMRVGIQGIGTLLVIYGFWIEPHRLTLTRQKLATHKLPKGTRFTLLHLGDLHVERITGRERQLNQRIAELNPDLIVFTGDFLNLSYLRDAQAWEAARRVVSAWKAPLSVYAVTGSPAVDREEFAAELLAGMPLRWLRDEKVSVMVGEDAQIDLLGLSCTHKPFVDAPQLKRLAPTPPARFTVLLYHSPDLAPDAAELGVDLHLSGHTHGGQVHLPFYGALFTASLYGKQFEAGRYAIQKLVLYITRGIGMEGAGAPRVRFLCPPEIILWEIEGQGPEA